MKQNSGTDIFPVGTRIYTHPQRITRLRQPYLFNSNYCIHRDLIYIIQATVEFIIFSYYTYRLLRRHARVYVVRRRNALRTTRRPTHLYAPMCLFVAAELHWSRNQKEPTDRPTDEPALGLQLYIYLRVHKHKILTIFIMLQCWIMYLDFK